MNKINKAIKIGVTPHRRDLIRGNVEQAMNLVVADDYFYAMKRFTEELTNLQWYLLGVIK